MASSYPEQQHYPDDELAESVGESPDHMGPAPIARMERGLGGVLVVVSAIVIFAAMVLLAFGLAPVGLVILLFLPIFWLGAWLRRRGAARLDVLERE